MHAAGAGPRRRVWLPGPAQGQGTARWPVGRGSGASAVSMPASRGALAGGPEGAGGLRVRPAPCPQRTQLLAALRGTCILRELSGWILSVVTDLTASGVSGILLYHSHKLMYERRWGVTAWGVITAQRPADQSGCCFYLEVSSIGQSEGEKHGARAQLQREALASRRQASSRVRPGGLGEPRLWAFPGPRCTSQLSALEKDGRRWLGE